MTTWDVWILSTFIRYDKQLCLEQPIIEISVFETTLHTVLDNLSSLTHQSQAIWQSRSRGLPFKKSQLVAIATLRLPDSIHW